LTGKPSNGDGDQQEQEVLHGTMPNQPHKGKRRQLMVRVLALTVEVLAIHVVLNDGLPP
jgi:hypothetical protein